MFLIDDILLLPARGLIAVFREVNKAVQQDIANEGQSTRSGLSELYMMLETGQISEEEFDRREKALLDRLDALEARVPPDVEEDAEDKEEADFPEEITAGTIVGDGLKAGSK